MSSDFSELSSLSADLRGVPGKVGPLVQLAVRKTAKDIQGSAKRRAPVKTGNLKGSITTSDLRQVGQSGSLEAEIGPTANYGLFVEMGTSRMAAQPYLGPAADIHEPAFMAAILQLAGGTLDG